MRAPPEAAPAGAGRRDGLFIMIFLAAACAVATVDVFSVVDDRARNGHPVALWEPMVWEGSSVVVMTALAPAIMALVRRVRPLEAPWTRVLGAHLAGAVAFSLIHVTAMGALRWAVYALVGGHYPPLSPLGDFPYEFRKDLLSYAAFVIIYVAWLHLLKSPPATIGRGDPAELEIRDGARRHFVRLDEVAFIEAAGNYVELHRGQTPILHRAALSQMERQLRGQGFVRIHRSRLVQRARIAQVESKPSGDYVVRLLDGRELAGSRRYRRPLLEP